MKKKIQAVERATTATNATINVPRKMLIRMERPVKRPKTMERVKRTRSRRLRQALQGYRKRVKPFVGRRIRGGVKVSIISARRASSKVNHDMKKGEVVEIIRSERKVNNRKYKASEKDPRIVVKSAKSGKEAVHKPGAVYF